MRIFLAFCIFSLFCIANHENCSAQSGNTRIVSHDSTPIAELDYHLSKDQFISYYGIDDTARAVIHMYYRKRGDPGRDFALIPGLSCLGGCIFGYATGAIALFDALGGSLAMIGSTVFAGYVGFVVIVAGGTIVYPICVAIKRTIFTRENLLTLLV